MAVLEANSRKPEPEPEPQPELHPEIIEEREVCCDEMEEATDLFFSFVMYIRV